MSSRSLCLRGNTFRQSERVCTVFIIGAIESGLILARVGGYNDMIDAASTKLHRTLL